MRLFIAKDKTRQETRVLILPPGVGKLVSLGATVEIEAGLGKALAIDDAQYEQAGARISSDGANAELVLQFTGPAPEDIRLLADGAIHVSHMDPFTDRDVVKAFAAAKVSSISLKMLPRTTIAQKMDVLSSQANLAGYAAVIQAAEHQRKIFPMMMTPAGTIAPARVFVIGAGVAGLQAIATAKRLGARVDAFDVRQEAQEQILSVGARPLKVDLEETGQTKDGYAKKLTDEQLEKQRQAMAQQCAKSDVVITTARVMGRQAPLIVTNAMLDGMQPGSVVVDLAVEAGGNVEASKLGKVVDRKGVTIIGLPELSRQVPLPASEMLTSNLCNFIEHFWNKEDKRFVLNQEDEIMRGCLITHQGDIVNETIKAKLAEGA